MAKSCRNSQSYQPPRNAARLAAAMQGRLEAWVDRSLWLGLHAVDGPTYPANNMNLSWFTWIIHQNLENLDEAGWGFLGLKNRDCGLLEMSWHDDDVDFFELSAGKWRIQRTCWNGKQLSRPNRPVHAQFSITFACLHFKSCSYIDSFWLILSHYMIYHYDDTHNMPWYM